MGKEGEDLTRHDKWLCMMYPRLMLLQKLLADDGVIFISIDDTAHPEIPAVGNYITLTGKADRIDPVFRTLQVGDTVVPFEDLVEISGEGIMEIDQYLGISEE